MTGANPPFDHCPEMTAPEICPVPTKEQRRAFAVIAAVVFGLTFLKGFRLPNLWSATQFAFNYSQGFVRRGLIGEIARRIGGDEVFYYYHFVIYALIVLVLVAIFLGWAIRLALRADPSDLGFWMLILVCAASPGMVMVVNTVGYYDHLGFLAVLLLVIWGPKLPGRYAIFYVVLALGLLFALIHEALAVMFAPVMVFTLACHIVARSKAERLGIKNVVALVTCLVLTASIVFVVSSIVSTLGTEDFAKVRALQLSIRRHTDFVNRPDAFEVLERSSRENLLHLMPEYWSYPANRRVAIKSAIAFAPSFAFLVYYGLRAVERPTLSRAIRWILRALFLGAVISPLLLNFVGWDWNRWNGLSLVAGFCCVLALKRYLPPFRPSPCPVHLWALGAIAAVISLASTTVLFDAFQVQFFPFEQQFEFIRNLFKHDFRYRPLG